MKPLPSAAPAGLESARRSLVYRQNRLQKRANRSNKIWTGSSIIALQLRQLELRMMDLAEEKVAEARQEARRAIGLLYPLRLDCRRSGICKIRSGLEEDLQLLSAMPCPDRVA